MISSFSEDRPLNLALDIGNTAVKAGIFEQDTLVKALRFSRFNHEQITNLVSQYGIDRVIYSSVREKDIPAISAFSGHVKTLLELTPQTPLPIDNRYETPHSLGNDRLAGVVGGQALFPNTPLLVIDAGTALTIDFLDESGSYLGGNISPGLALRFESLHQATGRLPKVDPQENLPLLGKNTRQAIAAGVQNGIIYEINQYMHSFAQAHGSVKVLLTGGDCNFFDNKLNYPIFVEPNLVLIGLNKILKYNIYAR